MSAARPQRSATRTLARLYSPPAQAPLLAALCALEGEIRASLEPGLDHQVAHLRLEWWRAECTRTAAGEAAHPLTRALAACFADPAGPQGTAPLAGLPGLVDTAVWDLAAATFETRGEAAAYCERWADAMIVPLIAHGAPEVGRPAARALGAALCETELLAGLARDAHAGRLRLPLDELAAAGLDPTWLTRRPPWPAALAALLRTRRAALRSELAAAIDALPPQRQPPLRGLLVWAALASCEERGVLDGWRAWQAARRATRGRFRLAAARGHWSGSRN